MKPIGIGQLSKAKPKSIQRPQLRTETPTPIQPASAPTDSMPLKTPLPSSPMTQPDPVATHIPLEHVIPTQPSDDQEGQLSVDMYQTDSELIIVAPVAGTPPDQVHVSITDDVITIKGRRELPLKETFHESNIYLQECFWGNFSRSIILPAAVDLNRVEARFKNNVLTIRIPKTERVRSRVIRIEE